MLLPLSLLFVGAALLLNGLWMTGRIADREVIVINLTTAAITGTVALLSLVRAATVEDVRGVAMTLLFSVTYLWVAMNRVTGSDGRGLGWFSLFVALSVLPEACRSYAAATTVLETWLALCWFSWAGLWFMYFMALALQRPIQAQTALATMIAGVITAWSPALYMMHNQP